MIEWKCYTDDQKEKVRKLKSETGVGIMYIRKCLEQYDFDYNKSKLNINKFDKFLKPIIYYKCMKEKICIECAERGKDWKGSNLRCAFEEGSFSQDNWNCATMNKLRQIIYDRINGDRFNYDVFYHRDDINNCTIGVIPMLTISDLEGYLVMTWYKERGSVGNAYIICDDEPIRNLTLDDANAIIWSYNDSKYKIKNHE